MSDIFISYSRRDSEFVRTLHERLSNQEYDVWVDWEDILPTVDWWQAIQGAIEEADVFAFVITPESVQSDICRDEIQHAMDNNKRFIPILYKSVNAIDSSVIHPAVRTHNWIDFSDEAKFDDALDKLVESFSLAPEYLHRHTRLLVRAKEWQNSNRQTSYLLKGAELREFQDWLQQGQTLTPNPTELQYDYILTSQMTQNREQARLVVGLLIGVLIVAILGVSAYLQREQISAQNARSTIQAQDQAFIAATAFAQGTQIAAQNTRIADVQVNATNIIQEANLQNTQSALQGQISALRQTIEALNTREPVASATASSTLPPTRTSTPTRDPQIAATDGAGAAGIATATVDMTVTAEQSLYSTATAESQITPTLTPTEIVPTAESQVAVPQTQFLTYTVQEGDFAVTIARRFGVTVREIIEANDLNNASLIFQGQQLLIPYSLDFDTALTLYVSPNGADTPVCGSAEAPCQTINHVLSQTDLYAEIRLGGGIYTEPLVIDQDVVLVGTGAENTILTGDFTGTIVTVNPNINVAIIGITITGGSADWGAAIANYGDVTLNNMRISSNVANIAGGGIANFGRLTANFVDFIDNYAPLYNDLYNAQEGTLITTDGVNYIEETSLPEPVEVDGPFNIGVLVRVDTTEGDRLNLRRNPNTEEDPITALNPGTPLMIVGGPEENEGLRWWNVRTVNGTNGWVVDFFEDEPTLSVIDAP
ncbi:MAG: TIR domain-containing protein [Anaerolineae bacterium]